ncbi:MAG: hypothetical protein ACR5LD_07820 [Symbiopectobacterium sp.]
MSASDEEGGQQRCIANQILHTQAEQPSLYSRLDLAYDGKARPSYWKTMPIRRLRCMKRPFQWLWLEDQKEAGKLPQNADQ